MHELNAQIKKAYRSLCRPQKMCPLKDKHSEHVNHIFFFFGCNSKNKNWHKQPKYFATWKKWTWNHGHCPWEMELQIKKGFLLNLPNTRTDGRCEFTSCLCCSWIFQIVAWTKRLTEIIEFLEHTCVPIESNDSVLDKKLYIALN